MTDAIDSACLGCGTPLDGAEEFPAPDRHHGVTDDFSVRVCRVCGSGRTFPLVSDSELGRYYPGEYNAHTAPPGRIARVLSWAIRRFQGWRGLRSEPLRRLAERSPGRVVDVGSGRGDLGVTLMRSGWAVTGVEPSEGATTEAASRGLEVFRGTLGTVTLDPESYDAVVFQHSLEHTNDPVADLRIARAALRPGGLVLVAMPNFGCWQARRFRSCWYHLDVPRHRAHMTPDGLRRACEQAGLEIEEVGSSTSPVGLPATVQYRIFGRCLFPAGLSLRVSTALCALVLPLSALANRLGGGGDVLWAVARRA